MKTFGSTTDPVRVPSKAAQQRRTPKRTRVLYARNDGHVLECGSVLPLWVG